MAEQQRAQEEAAKQAFLAQQRAQQEQQAALAAQFAAQQQQQQQQQAALAAQMAAQQQAAQAALAQSLLSQSPSSGQVIVTVPQNQVRCLSCSRSRVCRAACCYLRVACSMLNGVR